MISLFGQGADSSFVSSDQVSLRSVLILACPFSAPLPQLGYPPYGHWRGLSTWPRHVGTLLTAFLGSIAQLGVQVQYDVVSPSPNLTSGCVLQWPPRHLCSVCFPVPI